jgi:hypothetical protein
VAALAGTVSGGSYTFQRTNADHTPVRFDPCAPIHYVTNLSQAPPRASADVAQAITILSGATGLRFVDDGSSTDIPSSARSGVAAGAKTWAPVLIAWSHHGESDLLPGGAVAGEGVSAWLPATGNSVAQYVSGQVAIDAPAAAALQDGFGPGRTVGELLLHELAHVVGLGHTDDPTQLMAATLVGRDAAAFGSGDLAGLRQLGGGGCLSGVRP